VRVGHSGADSVVRRRGPVGIDDSHVARSGHARNLSVVLFVRLSGFVVFGDLGHEVLVVDLGVRHVVLLQGLRKSRGDGVLHRVRSVRPHFAVGHAHAEVAVGRHWHVVVVRAVVPRVARVHLILSRLHWVVRGVSKDVLDVIQLLQLVRFRQRTGGRCYCGRRHGSHRVRLWIDSRSPHRGRVA